MTIEVSRFDMPFDRTLTMNPFIEIERREFARMAILVLAVAVGACDGSASSRVGPAPPAPPVSPELDPTFGSGGIVVQDLSSPGLSSIEEGRDILIDAAGRILVVGTIFDVNSSADMAIWALDSFGNLDSSFGSGGMVRHDNAAGGFPRWEEGQAIAVDASGRILVAGMAFGPDSTDDLALWRFDPAGNLDTSFGSGGVLIYDDPTARAWERGNDLSLDISGRIIVAGYRVETIADADLAIWRFNADGSADTTFGNGGLVLHHNAAGGNGNDFGEALAVTAGRIYVTGWSWSAGQESDMVIWAFDSTGALISNFGSGGFVVHHSAAGGNLDDEGRAIAIDGTGRILVAGWSSANLHRAMVIWAYDGLGQADGTFGSGGVLAYPPVGPRGTRDEGRGLALDGAGGILVCGSAHTSATTPDMAIWRSTPAGAWDPGFGMGGLVTHNGAAGGDREDEGYAIAIDSSGRLVVTGYSYNASDNKDMVVWRYR